MFIFFNWLRILLKKIPWLNLHLLWLINEVPWLNWYLLWIHHRSLTINYLSSIYVMIALWNPTDLIKPTWIITIHLILRDLRLRIYLRRELLNHWGIWTLKHLRLLLQSWLWKIQISNLLNLKQSLKHVISYYNLLIAQS